MPSKKTESTTSTMTVDAIGIGEVIVNLVGETELITHNFDEKQKKKIGDGEGGNTTPKNKKKQPRTEEVIKDEYERAYYRTSEGKPAFKANGLKLAMVSACRDLDLKMTEARGRFHVIGDAQDLLEITPAKNGEPYMRTDTVRVGNGSATLRYRPGFPAGWTVKARIQYNKAHLTPEAVVNILNQAGFGVGLCEWRPEKNGPHGRFHVESVSLERDAA